MPKTFATPFPDSDALRSRLQECAQKLGSVNALAKASGIPQSTIRNYFTDGEPSRYNIVAIAKAAGVSVSWLATGESEGGGITESEALPKDPWQEIEFQDRFNSLLNQHGGVEGLAKLTGIPLRRLEQIKAGGEFNRSEWRALSTTTKACIGWLIGAEDEVSKDIKPPESELTEFIKHHFYSNEIKEEIRRMNLLNPPPSTWKSAPVSRASVASDILLRLPPSGLIPFTMKDDSMEPTINKGDLLIFTQASKPDELDVYLIEDKQRNAFIVCRLCKNGGKTLGIRDNPRFASLGAFEYHDSTYTCHGRLYSRFINVSTPVSWIQNKRY